MKVIVLGDIHANLPALAACWAEAEKEGFDWIVHTGDVVGYGAFPDECVAYLHERNIPGSRGNFDENVGFRGEESGALDSDPVERDLADASFRWTTSRIGLRARRWLADLPFEVRRRLDGLTFAVYHAGPIDLTTTLLQETPEPRFVEYGHAANADVVILGHAHRFFSRVVDGRTFINAGSVGRPRDGDPRTGYAVIEIGDGVRVTFRRLAYDADGAARAMTERGLPDGLAERILQGR